MDHLGYFALFIGSLMEGETALITGSFLAHRGYFEISKVALICFLAAQTIDMIYFIVGRRQGRKFVQKRPKLESKMNKLMSWIEAHPIMLMIFYRFLYGVRIPLVIAFGLSSYSLVRFAVLSFIGTVLWVASYSALGYYFGVFIKANFSIIQEYEFVIVVAIIVISMVVFYLIRKHNATNLDEEKS